MKKILLSLFLLLAIRVAAFETFAMVKCGASTCTDQIMEEIYPGWYVGYGAEVGVFVNASLSFSLNYLYNRAEGQSIIFNPPPIIVNTLTHSTDFSMHSLGFLAKGYLSYFPCIRPYVGIGPTLFFPVFSDNSPFVVRHPKRSGIGGTIAAGLQLGKGHFYANPFVEYDFVRIDFLNVGSSLNFSPRLDYLLIGLAFGSKF